MSGGGQGGEYPDAHGLIDLLRQLKTFVDSPGADQENDIAPAGAFADDVSSGSVDLKSELVRNAVLSRSQDLKRWLIASATKGEEMGIPPDLIPTRQEVVYYCHLTLGLLASKEVEDIDQQIRHLRGGKP